jgi:hypothetical protein
MPTLLPAPTNEFNLFVQSPQGLCSFFKAVGILRPKQTQNPTASKNRAQDQAHHYGIKKTETLFFSNEIEDCFASSSKALGSMNSYEK